MRFSFWSHSKSDGPTVLFYLEQTELSGWRARWDLNPGFSAPEADALSVLDYEPTSTTNRDRIF